MKELNAGGEVHSYRVELTLRHEISWSSRLSIALLLESANQLACQAVTSGTLVCCMCYYLRAILRAEEGQDTKSPTVPYLMGFTARN